MNEKLIIVLKKRYYLISFLFFNAVLFSFYYKTRGAGFVSDMVEWVYDYKTHPNFNYFFPVFDITIRPVYHFILYNLYNTFGLIPKVWFVFFCLFFAIVCTTILLFFNKLYKIFEIQHAKKIAFIGTLGFVISPLCSEIIVWYATIHYQVVLLCLFLILYIILIFEKMAYWGFILNIILFSVAILSIELSYAIIPCAFFLYSLLVFLNKTTLTFRKYVLLITLPQVLIFIIYNALIYIYYFRFLGHYKIIYSDLSPIYFFSHFVKLICKHLFLVNYFGQSFYEYFFNFIDQYAYLLSTIVVLMALVYVTKNKIKLKTLSSIQYVQILIWLGVISLYFPISILYFQNYKEIELDRLGVGMSIFLIQSIVLYVFSHKNSTLKYIILPIFFFISIGLLNDYTNRWKDSKMIRHAFLDHLPDNDSGNTYILSVPILYKYVYVFSINDTLELKRSLILFNHKTPKTTYYIPAFHNCGVIDQVVSATKLDSNLYQCQLRNWGCWFWKNLGTGLLTEKKDLYEITRGDDNQYFNIKFLQLKPKDKIYLFNKLQFHEIDDKKAKIGDLFL